MQVALAKTVMTQVVPAVAASSFLPGKVPAVDSETLSLVIPALCVSPELHVVGLPPLCAETLLLHTVPFRADFVKGLA